MLPATVYFAFLAIVCAYALWRGGVEERVVAVTSIAASLFTLFVIPPKDVRYDQIEWGVMAIDLVVLVIYVGLALRSRRFWPLWVAGIQLTTSFAHAVKAMNFDLLPSAYAVAAQFWVYPILIILLIATIRRRPPEPSPAGTAPA
ncbi:hypothetical protein WJT74_08875 [Sphingomicrobium sp. XHP0239]|uniref:hypothetical protein n=1 Tax=Sphingomicrobium maritimum TaxID=3133972 RepID=UPI0031CCD4A9